MRTLVDMDIFKAITVYDYQAVCKVPEINEKAVKSFASILITVSNKGHRFTAHIQIYYIYLLLLSITAVSSV